MTDAWVKDDSGNIVVFPLAGHETMIVENRAIALRLPFLLQGDQPQRPSGKIQFIIADPRNARLFAEDILAAVARIEQTSA